MPNCRWFHLVAPVSEAIIEACLERQKLFWPDNELSIRSNFMETERVIKVDNASKVWRQTQPWIFNPTITLGVYDRDDHDNLKSILSTVEWYEPVAGFD